MKKPVILAGFGNPLQRVHAVMREQFSIVGVVKDYERPGTGGEEFNRFLDDQDLPRLRMQDVAGLGPAVFFSVNYNKIIDMRELAGVFALNLHVGLLPRYRGNSANAWAILNGERAVGYTIHALADELDGGDIYYRFEYELKPGETYLAAKTAINADLANVGTVVERILRGELPGTSQACSEFVYACRLVPEDGAIRSWERLRTDELVRRHIVFANPPGTGLHFFRDGVKYEITRLSRIPNFADAAGIAGAVVMKTPAGSIWVKTQDNAISIDEMTRDGRAIVPARTFKIGDRL